MLSLVGSGLLEPRVVVVVHLGELYDSCTAVVAERRVSATVVLLSAVGPLLRITVSGLGWRCGGWDVGWGSRMDSMIVKWCVHVSGVESGMLWLLLAV